jgi:hypothetical protein
LALDAAEHLPPLSLAKQLRHRAEETNANKRSTLEQLAQLLEQLDAQRYSANALSRPDRELTRQFAGLAKQLKSNGQ